MVQSRPAGGGIDASADNFGSGPSAGDDLCGVSLGFIAQNYCVPARINNLRSCVPAFRVELPGIHCLVVQEPDGKAGIICKNLAAGDCIAVGFGGIRSHMAGHVTDGQRCLCGVYKDIGASGIAAGS